MPNTGGPVDPADHIGHLAELEDVLLSTAAVGALLTGDRRMGKTSMLRKTAALLRPEHVVLQLSAEVSDPAVFGRRFLDALRGHRVFADELDRWDVEINAEISAEVGSFGLRLGRKAGSGTRRTQSDDAFEWAADRVGIGKLVVIIDEVTVLAQAIEKQHPGGAVEFLRSLRRPRQERDDVVILLSGSIGLHHVIDETSAINDLQAVRVGPLDDDSAIYLARCLLLGAHVDTANDLVVAEEIAEETSGIAYFVQHVVDEGRRRGHRMRRGDPRRIIDEVMLDPDDPWHIRHYRDRLPNYYGAAAQSATAILDITSGARDPVSIDRMTQLLVLETQAPPPTRDQVISLVERLEADHYLARLPQGSVFATPLLARAWQSVRRI